MRVDLDKGYIVSQVDSVHSQHLHDLIKRNGSTTIDVSLLEDIHGLILRDGWVDCPEKLEVLVEGQVFLVVHKAILVEIAPEVFFIAAEVEAQFGHDALHLVLVLLVLVRHPEEFVFEDWVHEDLVPGQPVLLVDLQTPLEEAHGFRRQVLALDDEGHSLDVLRELVLSVASPRRAAVQHLVEDEPERPDVALRGVLLRF